MSNEIVNIILDMLPIMIMLGMIGMMLGFLKKDFMGDSSVDYGNDEQLESDDPIPIIEELGEHWKCKYCGGLNSDGLFQCEYCGAVRRS